jgi:hypothetical protein
MVLYGYTNMGRNVEEPVYVRFRAEHSKRERFKIATIRLRTTMDEVLNQLLDVWLEENDPPGDAAKK